MTGRNQGNHQDDGESALSLMRRERAERSLRWAGAASSLALVIGLGIWGYRLAVRDVEGIPVIQALNGPVRVSPDAPGGSVADHQGLSVNTIAAAGVAAEPAERLILAPRPVDLTDEDVAGLALSGSAGIALEAQPAVSRTDLGSADGLIEAAPGVADPLADTGLAGTDDAIALALAEALGPDGLEAASAPAAIDNLTLPGGEVARSLRPVARPGGAMATLTETAAPAQVDEVDPSALSEGTRLVQFGAFETEDRARSEWIELAGRFTDLMEDKSMVLETAKSGGRAFFRLRAHGFVDEADARRFCAALEAEGAPCTPVAFR